MIKQVVKSIFRMLQPSELIKWSETKFSSKKLMSMLQKSLLWKIFKMLRFSVYLVATPPSLLCHYDSEIDAVPFKNPPNNNTKLYISRED